ncbi:hypothetical protein A6A03_12590 [Chloroflexus islandicus]|uniref:Uncharacterized protein n=2 Tax=Chloroflexus islandicus TaxID=1707952 RepID=A0A178MC61_9CHLR|nr:hypothetical protein A6A03_12590 [Chloroflexus islandicus]
MVRSRPILPLSVIFVGLAFFLWVSLSTSPGASLAQPSCDDRPAYPGCVEIPVNCDSYPANVCDITKTAVIVTRTAAAGPVLTQTALARGQQSQPATATPTATISATNTRTASPTTTVTPTTLRPNETVATQPPTITLLPVNTSIPTPSPTVPLAPTPTIQSALRCAPGDVLELTGATRPQTALLVMFDDRAVGGGASDRAGAFRIVLRIGDERPGVHDIVVRERERETVVAEYTCETPPPPTPTPTFGPIRVTVTP